MCFDISTVIHSSIVVILLDEATESSSKVNNTVINGNNNANPHTSSSSSSSSIVSGSKKSSSSSATTTTASRRSTRSTRGNKFTFGDETFVSRRENSSSNDRLINTQITEISQQSCSETLNTVNGFNIDVIDDNMDVNSPQDAEHGSSPHVSVSINLSSYLNDLMNGIWRKECSRSLISVMKLNPSNIKAKIISRQYEITSRSLADWVLFLDHGCIPYNEHTRGNKTSDPYSIWNPSNMVNIVSTTALKSSYSKTTRDDKQDGYSNTNNSAVVAERSNKASNMTNSMSNASIGDSSHTRLQNDGYVEASGSVLQSNNESTAKQSRRSKSASKVALSDQIPDVDTRKESLGSKDSINPISKLIPSISITEVETDGIPHISDENIHENQVMNDCSNISSLDNESNELRSRIRSLHTYQPQYANDMSSHDNDGSQEYFFNRVRQEVSEICQYIYIYIDRCIVRCLDIYIYR